MPLTAGTRLGPYEILSPLGSGGMGEVYKARDTRLDRLVALKTMRPDEGLGESGAASRARFEREAHAISRISHANICALFDVGRDRGLHYLVVELLDGETLAARIAKGPLPMADVLRIGVELAGALAAAHRHGIVHRDLKPGNVMLTASGAGSTDSSQAKLLDFGLAKTVEPPGSTGNLATTTGVAELTAKGTWIGTAPYMAPEQIQGQPVDARTDVFALGAVLYEMATGQRAFAGGTSREIIAAVVGANPPAISTAIAPPPFDRLVRECLAKDPEQRWQSAHDVALRLRAISDRARQQVATAASAGSKGIGPLGWILTAAAAVIALLAGWRIGTARAPGPEAVTLQLMPPASATFSYSFDTVTFALSPDGSQLAFVGTDPGGARRIWLRAPTSTDARPVADTDGAGSVFWSPDSTSIAFFANGTLKRLDLASGAALPICTVAKSIGLSGTWNSDGHILFASVEGEAIYGVSIGGGVADAEIKPDKGRGEARVLFPTYLPDGRRFLYHLRMNDGAGWLMMGETGKPVQRVMPVESNVAYVSPGALVFARGGTLVGQQFDRFTARVTGEPFAIAESVRFFVATGVATFSASPSGNLVYQSQRNRLRLAWVNRDGHELRSVGTPGDYLDMRLTPSGHGVLLSRALPATGAYDVWSLDLDRGSDTRLTLDDARTEVLAVMPPDGQAIIFGVPRGGPPRLVRRQLGTGREETLLPGEQFQQTSDVSPDGRLLAYSERAPGGVFNLWMVPLAGPRSPTILRRTSFDEGGLRFSPDGEYITFLSTESRAMEAYVAPVAGKPETLVSTGGASMARWSRDGSEIVYLSADRRLIAVPVVRNKKALQLGAPVTLFALSGRPWVSFDVGLDGNFLALIQDVNADEQPLTARLHWNTTIR